MTATRPIANAYDARSVATRGTPVPQQVAARAAERPNALAVRAGSYTLTYGELDQRANRLARQLRSLGIDSDVLVGLCLPRSPDLAIGALGIMKAGGAYVPMDPGYPPARLAYMLDDARAPVLITTPELAPRFRGPGRTIVALDASGDASLVAGPDLESPLVDVAAEDLAYVIYTSGSTGTPKGVELTHAGLANLVSWHNTTFSVSAADRASHVAGLGFDAAVWELWPYLVAGASVHMADDATRCAAELLREWIVTERITIGFVPTPLADRMLGAESRWPSDSRLRVMLTGGDALHHFPHPDLPFTLVNNYGPTECTVVATSGAVPPVRSAVGLPPIGRGIDNVDVHLLDDRLRPVSVGEPGEICISGAGLARGYHNRPDLTAERFVTVAVGDAPGRRLYRTGDLGRRLPDGQLAFLGRLDDQIKIRGYRVEPGDVESVLTRQAGVRECVVVAREDVPGDMRLVAYLVLASGAAPTPAGLRESLRESLPEYMLPAAFVRLDALPLTAHGKTDRAALPAPDPSNTLSEGVAEDSFTATELRVAALVGSLLQVEEIGLDDDFFMLGGHSLLGAQLIARLREAFGVEIGLRSLFEAPTVAALAAEVDRLTAMH